MKKITILLAYVSVFLILISPIYYIVNLIPINNQEFIFLIASIVDLVLMKKYFSCYYL